MLSWVYSGKIYRILFSAFLILFLSSCGWHLRGSGSTTVLTFKVAQVEDKGADAALAQQVVQALSAAGVKLDEAAAVRIVLAPTQWRISRTGYTLTGDVVAELLSLEQPFTVFYKGKPVLEDETVVYRDHQIDTRALAAAESEKRSLQVQMRQEAAMQIVRQLGHLSLPTHD